MEAVKSAFHAADRTGDGKVSFQELRILLKYLIFYDDAYEYVVTVPARAPLCVLVDSSARASRCLAGCCLA
jgi:hypothetical protein